MKLSELFEGLFEKFEKQLPIPLETSELSMNHKDRMDRAKALGFDINNIFYHGSKASFKSFNPKLSGTNTNTGAPENSIYLTNNPTIAASYAGEETDYAGNISNYKQGGNIMPLIVKKPSSGKMMVINARGSNWNDLYLKNYPDFNNINDFAHYAQSKNKDYLLVKNVVDSGTWVNKNNRSKRLSNVLIVFHPENIRSIFAKFDPANLHDEDLMA